jgi:hypothetical protein
MLMTKRQTISPLEGILISVPVLVAVLAICIEMRIPSKGEIVCLFVISMGVMCVPPHYRIDAATAQTWHHPNPHS